ncbi:hypothetical protein Fot_32960 [Forsythia ovata]|uniref:Uncharacterized protein n=1 Tax=Forsythia ovata TaxID=205694 RepID=A0ABD1T9U8_9LAMI
MLAGELESQQLMSATLQANLDSGQCSSQSSSSALKVEIGAASEGLKFGHISMMGRKRLMEDAVSVAPPGKVGREWAAYSADLLRCQQVGRISCPPEGSRSELYRNCMNQYCKIT